MSNEMTTETGKLLAKWDEEASRYGEDGIQYSDGVSVGLRIAAKELREALARDRAAQGEVRPPFYKVDDVVAVNGVALSEVVALGKRYTDQLTVNKPRAAQVFEALVMIANAAATLYTRPPVAGDAQARVEVTDEMVRRAEQAREDTMRKVTAYGSAGIEERYLMAMRAALLTLLENNSDR